MKFLLGSKLNMTQIFQDNGTVVPVTRISAGPCVVTQVQDREDGARSVQLGFGNAKKLNKPMQGHLKDLPSAKYLRQFNTKQELKRGDTVTVASFEAGERVDVTGTSKGKGFQGVVRRHGFHGSPASHGHKDQLRMPGSIGATDAARVFKGTRMGGHMGDERVTVKNLEVVAIDVEKNELFIKGAVPGARGGLIMIFTNGEMQVSAPKEDVKEEKTEEAPKEVEATEKVAETPEVKDADPASEADKPAEKAEKSEAPAESESAVVAEEAPAEEKKEDSKEVTEEVKE